MTGQGDSYQQPPPQQQQYQQPPPQPYQPPPQYLQPMPNRFHLHGDIVQRFVALLIDYIILIVIYFVIAAIIVFTGVVSGGYFGMFGTSVGGIALSMVLFVITLLYFVIQEGGSSNTTIGKSAMSLKVVDEQYQPITMEKALVRNIFRAMWSLPFFVGFLLFIVDVIFVLTRDDKQRLGDIIAHTYVIREDAVSRPQPFYAPPQQYQQPPPQQQQYQQPPPQQQQYQQPPPQQPPPQQQSQQEQPPQY